MTKETRIKIEKISSLEDKMSIEAEVEVLDGVDGINVNEANGNCCIKFDEDKISFDEIVKMIKDIGIM